MPNNIDVPTPPVEKPKDILVNPERIDSVQVRYFFEGLDKVNKRLWPDERITYMRERARGVPMKEDGSTDVKAHELSKAEEDRKESLQRNDGRLDERAIQSLWLEIRDKDGVGGEQRKIGQIDPSSMESTDEVVRFLERHVLDAQTRRKQEQLKENIDKGSVNKSK